MQDITNKNYQALRLKPELNEGPRFFLPTISLPPLYSLSDLHNRKQTDLVHLHWTTESSNQKVTLSNT